MLQTPLRYLNLLQLLTKLGLMRQMAYRPHFFMMITGKVIRMGLLFFFYQAIFLKVDRIGSWTYDQVLLLFATFHLVDYLMSITFQRNLSFALPARIRTGELDAMMLLPVNLLFFVSLENIDAVDFFSSLPCFALLGYVLYRLQFAFSWVQALTYVLLLCNALIFLFAVVLMIAAVSFWTTQSYGLARIFDNLLKVGRYPLDIFEGFWKLLFIYLLPLILIAQLPSQALLTMLTPAHFAYAFGVSAIFLALAMAIWKTGLKAYASASI